MDRFHGIHFHVPRYHVLLPYFTFYLRSLFAVVKLRKFKAGKNNRCGEGVALSWFWSEDADQTFGGRLAAEHLVGGLRIFGVTTPNMIAFRL